jgi:WhiB family redox-sensing transcriptional regulator
MTGAKRFDLIVTSSLDWKQRGACVGADPDDFHPKTTKRRKTPASEDSMIARAKAICATCEVRAECLSYALDRPEKEGVWGGMAPEEREAVLKRRVRLG